MWLCVVPEIQKRTKIQLSKKLTITVLLFSCSHSGTKKIGELAEMQTFERLGEPTGYWITDSLLRRGFDGNNLVSIAVGVHSALIPFLGSVTKKKCARGVWSSHRRPLHGCILSILEA